MSEVLIGLGAYIGFFIVCFCVIMVTGYAWTLGVCAAEEYWYPTTPTTGEPNGNNHD